jgi:hypothetical protein
MTPLRALRAMILGATAIGATCALMGCGAGSSAGATNGLESGEAIARAEEAEHKKEEQTELAKDREVLSEVEASRREEVAEQNAKKKEAAGSARAKAREAAAERVVRKREKEAKKRQAAARAQAKKDKAAKKKKAPVKLNPVVTPESATVAKPEAPEES